MVDDAVWGEYEALLPQALKWAVKNPKDPAARKMGEVMASVLIIVTRDTPERARKVMAVVWAVIREEGAPAAHAPD